MNITIQEYAAEVDKQDRLQQAYFAYKRNGIHNCELYAQSRIQEKKVRELTKRILHPEPSLF